MNSGLVVIGCMAERLKDELKKKFPVVSDVIDNEHKNKGCQNSLRNL